MAKLVQIEKYLKQRRIPYQLVNLDQKAFTVEDVVRAGVDLSQVVKTLIIGVQPRSSPGLEHGKTIFGPSTHSVRSGSSGFVALTLRGNDRVDFKKVRKLFGSKTELARQEEVLKVVGVPIGAVCPVLVGIALYIDSKVMTLKNVHMGSGDLKFGLEMKLGDLLKAVGDYQLEDFST